MSRQEPNKRCGKLFCSAFNVESLGLDIISKMSGFKKWDICHTVGENKGVLTDTEVSALLSDSSSSIKLTTRYPGNSILCPKI